MKYRLPILTLPPAMLLAVWLFGWPVQPSRTPAQTQPPEPLQTQTASPSADRSAVDGDRLLTESLRMLKAQSSIEAQIRQQGEMLGHEILGTGIYRRWSSNLGNLLRLEMKMQVADQAVSVQQVCDGRFLWIQQNLPGQSRLSRIDLEKVEQALTESASRAEDSNPEQHVDGLPRSTRPAISPAAVTEQLFTLGGLPSLVEGLRQHFHFQKATAQQLGSEPVWVMKGRWRAESLKSLVDEAGQGGAQKPLPAHLPTHVTVVLGRDRLLPYFPFRIDFQRADAEDPQQPPVSLMTLELFEVRLGVPMNQSQFQFQAGEEELNDDTQQYLDQLARRRERAGKLP